MNSDQPIALDAYEALADAYAFHVDTKPHNAYYERPATQSLLPDVNGLRVLDAGCGPGVYAEWLLSRGAEVVGLDASPRMIQLARRRVDGRAAFHVADLARPLHFLEDESFDVIISALVLEYVKDWRTTLHEFHRVLRPSGIVVVSVTHPQFDFQYFKSERYFDTELQSGVWSGFTPVRVTMPTYRRSLAATLNPFMEAGFCLQRLLEPLPTEEFKRPDLKHFNELEKQPCFLCIRAAKAGIETT